LPFTRQCEKIMYSRQTTDDNVAPERCMLEN
jgi:hypothetical protein